MSFNPGQPPTTFSESTAIEIRRQEGTVRSFVSAQTVVAGTLMKLTNSGLIYMVGTEDTTTFAGVALYQAASGARTVLAKGQLRAFWDGAGTGTPGATVAPSATQSGWFTFITADITSGAIGSYEPLPGGVTLVAANSGTLQPILVF